MQNLLNKLYKSECHQSQQINLDFFLIEVILITIIVRLFCKLFFLIIKLIVILTFSFD